MWGAEGHSLSTDWKHEGPHISTAQHSVSWLRTAEQADGKAHPQSHGPETWSVASGGGTRCWCPGRTLPHARGRERQIKPGAKRGQRGATGPKNGRDERKSSEISTLAMRSGSRDRPRENPVFLRIRGTLGFLQFPSQWLTARTIW